MLETAEQMGWIYVCIDLHRPGFCKVGMTAGSLTTRTGTQTANPGYMLVVAFAVPAGEVHDIEKYLHRKIYYGRDVHRSTGNSTEWFVCTPQEAVNAMKHSLANCVRGLVDEDGTYLLSQIAELGELSPEFLLLLAGRTRSREEVAYYFDSVNAVRDELGLPLVPWVDPYAPYTWPRNFGGRL